MKHFVLFLICSLVLVTSCNKKESNGVEINESGVPVIDVENITKKGELKLSDILEDYEIIRLETSQKCLIDNVMRKYVLTSTS